MTKSPLTAFGLFGHCLPLFNLVVGERSTVSPTTTIISAVSPPRFLLSSSLTLPYSSRGVSAGADSRRRWRAGLSTPSLDVHPPCCLVVLPSCRLVVPSPRRPAVMQARCLVVPSPRRLIVIPSSHRPIVPSSHRLVSRRPLSRRPAVMQARRPAVMQAHLVVSQPCRLAVRPSCRLVVLSSRRPLVLPSHRPTVMQAHRLVIPLSRRRRPSVLPAWHLVSQARSSSRPRIRSSSCLHAHSSSLALSSSRPLIISTARPLLLLSSQCPFITLPSSVHHLISPSPLLCSTVVVVSCSVVDTPVDTTIHWFWETMKCKERLLAFENFDQLIALGALYKVILS